MRIFPKKKVSYSCREANSVAPNNAVPQRPRQPQWFRNNLLRTKLHYKTTMYHYIRETTKAQCLGSASPTTPRWTSIKKDRNNPAELISLNVMLQCSLMQEEQRRGTTNRRPDMGSHNDITCITPANLARHIKHSL